MKPIAAILQEIRPEFDFTTSDDFIRDGMLDSFDVVTLVAALDQEFGISIDGIDILAQNLRSIDAIRALLRRYGVDT